MAKKIKPVEVINYNKLPKPLPVASIEFDCPHCQRPLKRSSKYKGLIIRCLCGNNVLVP
jgi:hypothetical protein